MSAFFATVAVVIIHTPIWVWGLYGLLLFLGFQRTRDSVVSLFRLLILPLVVAVLAIASFIGSGPSGVPAIVVGLVIGGTVGWQLESDGATRRLPDGTLWLRGEWRSFVQLLLILLFRYVVNVVAAMNPVLNADPTWHFGAIFVSAALSASLLGRTAARMKVYFATDSAAA